MAAVASLNVNAIFKKAAPAKKAPAKKAPAPKRAAAGGKRSGNIGPNRTLWNGWESNPEPPAYLDGTLPGDAGFDPWGLSSPTEYLQFDLDSLDGSAAVNPSGNVIGKLKKVDNAPTERTIVVRLRSGEENLRAPRSIARATRDELSDRPVPTRISIRIVPSFREPFAANRARGASRARSRYARPLHRSPRAMFRYLARRPRGLVSGDGRVRRSSRSRASARLFTGDDPREAPARELPSLTFPPSSPTHSQPFNEAFDIVRFRECELQHSRWAMLGLVGVIAAESSTGISWADAGKVMAEQPSYLGFDINIPLTTIVWIEVLAMGFVEVKRSAGASPEPHPNPRIVGFCRAGHLAARQIPVGFRAIRLPPRAARMRSSRSPLFPPAPAFPPLSLDRA